MRLSPSLAIFAAAALAPLGAADLIIGQETCITNYGPHTVRHVPTYTTRQTVYVTLVSTKTKIPQATVTPTSTLTATSVEIDTTTLPQMTDTVTDTALATTTDVQEVDITITITVDVTSTITETPTVTASTASNFTPFASEPAVIAAGGGSGSPPSKKRHAAPHFPRRGLDLAARGKSAAKKKLAQAQYPQSVKCIVFVDDVATQTKTVTATTTNTHTAPAVISTQTVTATITSTVVPGDASTTVTATSTVTSVTDSVSIGIASVTVTSTTTTYVGATVTYYPQCQSNNLIEYVGGNPLYALSASEYTMSSTPDAVTCCQLCANTAGCAGFSGPTSGFTDCYIFGDEGTCNAATTDWGVSTGSAPNGDYDVVGNGNCGQGSYSG